MVKLLVVFNVVIKQAEVRLSWTGAVYRLVRPENLPFICSQCVVSFLSLTFWQSHKKSCLCLLLAAWKSPQSLGQLVALAFDQSTTCFLQDTCKPFAQNTEKIQANLHLE